MTTHDDTRRVGPARRRTATVLPLAAALVALAAAGPGAPARATHVELDSAQRRAARLEGEVALSSTRRPYLVLDLEERVLRYRLMGMTMREVPIPTLQIDGLLPANGGAAEAPALAGIVSLKEKEGDPRLNPLSPEQVEEGADDENAANVLPPEVPKEYHLTFNQKIAVRVAGEAEARGVSRVGAWFRSATARFRLHGAGGEALVKIRLALDPAIAIEVYRSLLPDQRWLVLPPHGYRLPEVGQEPPPKAKTARPRPTAPAKPKLPDAERGVPFAIPPPTEPPRANGEGDGGVPPVGEDGAPADDPNAPVPPENPPPRSPDAERLPDGRP